MILAPIYSPAGRILTPYSQNTLAALIAFVAKLAQPLCSYSFNLTIQFCPNSIDNTAADNMNILIAESETLDLISARKISLI